MSWKLDLCAATGVKIKSDVILFDIQYREDNYFKHILINNPSYHITLYQRRKAKAFRIYLHFQFQDIKIWNQYNNTQI